MKVVSQLQVGGKPSGSSKMVGNAGWWSTPMTIGAQRRKDILVKDCQQRNIGGCPTLGGDYNKKKQH